MDASRPSASGGLTIDDGDSDWEYEYHESETETYYVTLDISSESANINPKKRSKGSDTPASTNPEPSNTVSQNPPTTSLRDRAQNASRANRTTRNSRTIPDFCTQSADAVLATSQSAGNIDLAVFPASAEVSSIAAIDGTDKTALSTTKFSTLQTDVFENANLPNHEVQAQPIASQGSGPGLEVANSDTENIRDKARPGVFRSTNGTGEPNLNGSIELTSVAAAPLPTDRTLNSTTRTTWDPPPVYESREPKSSGSGPEEQIQILDFHTTNPLISFQKQLYSCTWTSTIGTDLLLAPPDSNFPHPLLKQNSAFSILAASGIKLIGRPVRLTRKEEERFNNDRLKAVLSSGLPDIEIQHEEAINDPRPVIIPVGAGSSTGRQNQARFLERLIAIKAAKGEKDSVTVYAQKTFTGTGWRAKQRADREALLSDGDIDSNDKPDTPALQATPRRPLAMKARKGAARRSAKTRATGGLFRDYRPTLGDEVGAGIGAEVTSTPARRGELPAHGADRSLGSILHVPTIQSTAPSADGIVTTPTLGVLSASVDSLASSTKSDQDLGAQSMASPAIADVAESEGTRIADVEMEDAPL